MGSSIGKTAGSGSGSEGQEAFTPKRNEQVKKNLKFSSKILISPLYLLGSRGFLQTCERDESDCFQMKLTEKIVLNHDSYIFRFGFPDKEQEFGLELGGHILFYADCPDPENGNEVSEIKRKYTPISGLDQKGYVDFLVKIYRAGDHPKFPNGGRMTRYLEGLEVGDSVKMRGPVSKKVYKGDCNWILSGEPHKMTHLGGVLGGSGITPFFQYMKAVVDNKDPLKISIVYGNKTEKDILLKDELDELQKQYPENIKIHYIIDKPEDPENWDSDVGYITREILEEHLPPPGPETMVIPIGPKPMNKLTRELLHDYTFY